MSKDDLKEWLDSQGKRDKEDLERALGMTVQPDKPITVGIIEHPSAAEAKAACVKLNSIPGVNACNNQSQVLVQPDSLRAKIDTLVAKEGWTIRWLRSVTK